MSDKNLEDENISEKLHIHIHHLDQDGKVVGLAYWVNGNVEDFQVPSDMKEDISFELCLGAEGQEVYHIYKGKKKSALSNSWHSCLGWMMTAWEWYQTIPN